MNAVKVARKQVEQIIAATFPDYRGRTVKVEPTESVYLADLNWGGGTRSQYRACTLDGKPLGSTDRYNAMAPWRNPAEGMRIPLIAGACLVEHCIFCGKDMGLRINVHPSDMPLYLTQS